MSSIIKVNTVQDTDGNNIINESGSTVTIGKAGNNIRTGGDNIQAADGGNLISQSGTTITLGASGDTITLAGGASQTGFGRTGTVDWQTASIKTATFTAVNGQGFFANTSGSAFNMNLPAGSAGDIVAVADYTNSFQTNNLTIVPNGTDKIGGANQNATIETKGFSGTFVFVDSTEGWKLINDATSATEGSPAFLAASGGTETTDGDFKVHTFTASSNFVVSAVGTDSTYGNKVEYLVVAPGGGGGSVHAGGGGAGGYRHNSAYDFTVTAQSYAITVGAKAAYITSGGTSTFSTITSAGGGRGGGDAGAASSGGSGGGGNSYPSGASGASGNTPSTTPSQGNNGGSGSGSGPNYGAGGGGGAGGTGGNGSSSSAGAAGSGSSNDIHGSSRVYSAGGGAHAHGGGSSAGGSSNQGGSAISLTAGGYNVSGAYGMGGGGNQSGTISGAPATGNSSQGVVIIRYKFQ